MYCDILSDLMEAGCVHLVLKILTFLTSWDLEAVIYVSQSWRKIVFEYFWRRNSVLKRILEKKKTGICDLRKINLSFQAEVLAAGFNDQCAVQDEKSNVYFMWFVLYSKLEKCWVENWLVLGELRRVGRVEISLNSPDIECADYEDDILVLGERSGNVSIYQLKNQKSDCVSVISTHTKPVIKVLVHDSVILSCSEDCSVTVIRITRNGCLEISHILQGHVSRVRCLSLLVKTGLLLTGSDDRTARIWNLSTRSNRAKTTLTPHRWGVTQVLLTPSCACTVDGKDILIWSYQGQLRARFGVQCTPSALFLDSELNCLLIGDTKGRLSGYNLRDMLITPKVQEETNICENNSFPAWSLETVFLKAKEVFSTEVESC
ncbi:probable E3 ubiquitin ligase complex SCF subunit sconB isoform X2 [Eurytemora carolleeae]|uniref:probable E3 ubiquitin ligase complex SCF subunit sconB isoform X2 n=1 Tax=Eurytemora carolleeae TaxID=1294199 RepID=UPI000C774FF4|nr:probable E3 ubiquitin ligase complex SCF subunit sconB isoform X2 [Eurytemora carolleeae]|eukprot:XP_023346764.1 probable E3 ubiquitin ligase complex SCF subunit sconB isoform X2 [Eurytemora affinis]